MEVGCRKFETLSKLDGDRVPQVDLGLGHSNVAYNLCADGDVRFKQCPWPTIPRLSSSWPSAHLESRARWRLLAAVTQAQCPGDAHRAVSLAIGREIATTMRSRHGRAAVPDALTLGAAENQLTVARALVVTGEWLRYLDTVGSRSNLPIISRRMAQLLSVEKVQSMCESLKVLGPRLEQCQVGRRLLRMFEERCRLAP